MFYTTIAEVYDYIFPQNKAQLTFINEISPITKDDRVLEIGCATGSLTELLSDLSDHVTGLDLDEALLRKAKSKYPNLTFTHANMLEIGSIYEGDYFDKIVSFGNTLVHLSHDDAVLDFFKQVHSKLKADGVFVVQIIHYDRILDQNIDHLSTISNTHITFKRNYDYIGPTINFNTELTIHSSNTNIKSSIPLLPIRQNRLYDLLTAAGFRHIVFYGNLQLKSLESNDVPLLFSCSK